MNRVKGINRNIESYALPDLERNDAREVRHDPSVPALILEQKLKLIQRQFVTEKQLFKPKKLCFWNDQCILKKKKKPFSTCFALIFNNIENTDIGHIHASAVLYSFFIGTAHQSADRLNTIKFSFDEVIAGK